MNRMGRLGSAAAVLALLALFFIANRGAYEGAFSDDDLDNIAWTGAAAPSMFVSGLVSPLYFPNHFRPVGHGTFYALGKTAGLRFRPYVALIHLLHLANTALVAVLLIGLGLTPWRAAAGSLFFVFHMALFDALWKPMYLFDLWCAFFAAGAFILYLNGRWVLALAAFWLAYKSKEHAVALPAVLLAYEWLLGERRWRRVAPFAVVAASFFLQGLWMNREAGQDYTLQFSSGALATTVGFYGPRLLLTPVALLGLALAAAVWLRDRRVWLGLAMMMLLIGPMLFLPTRLSGAYLYVAMTGLAVAVASALARAPWWGTALFFALWLPANYERMREERRAALTMAHENNAYLAAAAKLPVEAPGVRRFIYDGHPRGLRWWGILGALRIYYGRPGLEMFSVEEKNLSRIFDQGDVALLKWDNPQRRLTVVKRSPGEPDRAFIRMDDSTPIWQLEEGWYQAENRYRWTKPWAKARLSQPAGAGRFVVEVNVGPKYIADVKAAQLTVRIDGREIGKARFDAAGWRTVSWPFAAAAQPGPRPVEVEFVVEPEYRPSATDPRVLGMPIGAFGFVSSAQ